MITMAQSEAPRTVATRTFTWIARTHSHTLHQHQLSYYLMLLYWYYLIDVLRPVNREESYVCIPGRNTMQPIATSTILIHCLWQGPLLRIGEVQEKIQLNGSDRQTLGSYRNPVRRCSMQRYILTFHRLGKKESLIALGSHQGSILLVLCLFYTLYDPFREMQAFSHG